MMVRRKITRKTPIALKVTLWVLTASVIAGLVVLIKLYSVIFSPAVILTDDDSVVFYIETGSDYGQVLENLYRTGIIKDKEDFDWLARRKNFHKRVRPGRYRIADHLSNNDLINLLRSGRQEPVNVIFHNLRTLQELAGMMAKQLEPDSLSFITALTDQDVLDKYDFNMETFPSMFIPNTYQFFWNTTPERYISRMNNEYRAFWKNERLRKAEELNLSPLEVSILASIVEQESLHQEENPIIAGVFMNRIRLGMPLQSDPTIIFAWQDFGIRRVLNRHKEINSPYNTYRHRGLPPGPICIPSIAAMDAVLNYDKHNYLYFCAKEDFSGYHRFARTLAEHNRNARLYQQALNRRRIFN